MENIEKLEKWKKNYFLFTYKNNIPEDKYKSDFGWGCMGRSSQMLISMILYKYIFNDRKKVIDNMLGNLNFQNMINYSIKEFNYEVGTYMKFTTCMLSYQYLFNKENYDIKLIVNVDNFINLIDLYEDIFEKKFENNKISLDDFKNFPNKKFILSVSIILGIDLPNEEYINQFYNLIENDLFIGLLGGKNKSGYFFYELENENLYYLDPHEANEYSKNYEDFIPKDIKKINYKEINPCTMFTFKIFSYEDFIKFIKISEKSKDILFINDEKISFNSDDIIILE